MNSLMTSHYQLITIHSDTIANWELPIVTPKSGTTFGWRGTSFVHNLFAESLHGSELAG